MKKEVKIPTVLIIVTLALLVGVYWGSSATEKRQRYDINRLMYSNNSKVDEIWNIIERRYVDNVDNDTVTDRIYSAMLSSLDPHSSYLSRQMLSSENESLRGNFEGIGIMLRVINDTVRVSQVIEGGPSEKAGMLAGDRILEVDGEKVSGVKMKSDDIIKRMRGPRKSIADIKIKRPSEGGTRYIKVVRDVINTPSLSYSGMLDKETGYVRLTMFGETTHKEFCDAVKELKKEGMTRLVLDLRGNGGGLLDAAIGICDELLPGKEMIVYTQGQHQRRKEQHSSPGGLFAQGDLLVLVDEFSASASEIVSGAVQDNDRGVVMGRRTFGKGLVQQQFELSDGSAVQLTIARYYTPSGRCIQRPYDKGSDEYYQDFIEQIVAGYESDTLLMKVTDSTPYHTTSGRVVYAGGGIYPDHVIGYHTDTNIVYYNQLVNRGILNEYVFDKVSRDGQKIKQQYPTEKNYVKNYKVSDAMLEELFACGDKKGLKRNSRGIARYREEIRSRVKAEIGDMLYSTKTFYAVQLWADPELQEALKIWKP